MRRIIFLVTLAAATLSACTTINPYTGETQTSKATKGAAIGAAVGALAGIVSGDDATERRQRALIGAGIGALAGGGIGYYMDIQEAKLRQELAGTGVMVERQGDNIVLGMPGKLTFDTNKSEIMARSYPVLDSVARVISKNEKTIVEVVGHTDNTGSDAINAPLSRQRAIAVADYLASHQVLPARLATQGVSANYPIASNDTEDGRALNRRVEITLVPLTAP
jgi:outer membrane protein OmpA-like peptidoglycan-associated protein